MHTLIHSTYIEGAAACNKDLHHGSRRDAWLLDDDDIMYYNQRAEQQPIRSRLLKV